MKSRYLLLPLLSLVFLFSCTKGDNTITNTLVDTVLGWLAGDNPATVPDQIQLSNGASGTIPSAYDLTSKFPPIGNQGQYGTCVAWSTGYNMMSALVGMDAGLSPSQLASTSAQMSPKDLFTAIPDSKKGNSCDGTQFQNALNVLQTRGVATLSTVPYTGLGSCSQSSSDPNWATDASAHKIDYWRNVAGTVDAIKRNIADNKPVLIGATLHEDFKNINSDAVYQGGSGAVIGGHAMCIVGYDDSKGGVGAFKVVNSWSTKWGASGYCWVSYDYMLNGFVQGDASSGYNLYVAKTTANTTQPPHVDPVVSGIDFASWAFDEKSTSGSTGDPTSRYLNWDVYNVGSVSAPANGWTLYYLYYNAFDANDYNVITYENFTSNPQTSYDINAVLDPGVSLGNLINSNQSSGIGYDYNMPDITGTYYLVLFADGNDIVKEQDENNNTFYTSDNPIAFTHGSGVSGDLNDRSEGAAKVKPTMEMLRNSSRHSAVNTQNRNAYTPGEIRQLILDRKKSGELDQRAQAARMRNGGKGLIR
jgi:C1A family cysteine protease